MLTNPYNLTIPDYCARPANHGIHRSCAAGTCCGYMNMPSNKTITIAEAEAIAAADEAQLGDWDTMAKQAHEEAAQDATADNYVKAGSPALVRMWKTARNLDGKPISGREWQALCSAWYLTFGAMPPAGDDSYGSEEPQDGQQAAPEPVSPIEIEEKPQSIRDVAHVTGISVATLDRMVRDGRFPQPMRPSPGRKVWMPGDVRKLMVDMDHKR